MGGFSRRIFLARGSMAVAAAGVVGSLPVLTEVAAGPAGSESTAAATDASEALQMAEDVVAHVRNLDTGEISLFVGQRQITLNDPGLAHAIVRATGR